MTQRVALKVSSIHARYLCDRSSYRLAGGLFRDGNGVLFRFWDLGDRLPAFDRSGNALEAYTSVFEINGLRFYSVVDRWSVERNGFEARLCHDEIAFEIAGLIPHTVRFAD